MQFWFFSSLLTSIAAVIRFMNAYWFVVVVLAIHPVVMFSWIAWFLRTLRELREQTKSG